MAEPDPIAELLGMIARDGAPSQAWTARWSSGGDPVEATWAAAGDLRAMEALLALAGRAVRARRAQAAADEAYAAHHRREPRGRCETCAHHDTCARGRAMMVDAARHAAPVPPTLAELLAATRR